MRNAVVVLFLLSLFAAGTAVSQDEPSTSVITVKNSYKNNGGVLLQITKGTKNFELTCNETMPSCAELKKGNYRMLELPKNHGMYDCDDVKVYPESTTNTDESEPLGEYCMAAK
jgi:hypothetical protein